MKHLIEYKNINENLLQKVKNFVGFIKDPIVDKRHEYYQKGIDLYKVDVYKYIDCNISNPLISRISFDQISDRDFRYYFWIDDNNFIECVLYIDNWGNTKRISTLTHNDKDIEDINSLKIELKNVVLDAVEDHGLNDTEEEEEYTEEEEEDTEDEE